MAEATPAAPAPTGDGTVALAATPAATPAVPAQTPAATPAANPPVLLDTPAPAAPTAPTDNVVVYEKTGDAGTDMALKFIGERGFGPEHPAVKAALKGEFTELETALKALGDKAKGHEDILALAKDAHGRQSVAAKQAGEKVQTLVYEAVGGKDKWAPIQAWAQENADPAQKAEINSAFKAGGVAAQAMAMYLQGLHAKHGKPAEGGKTAVAATAAATTPTVEVLTPNAYAKAVQDLHNKLGSRMEDSSEYAALRSRFLAGQRR